MANPVLLHIPHASLVIPDEHRSSFLVSPENLGHQLLVHTDRYTDELFELPGVDRLVFPVSRLVVDPERFRDDADEPMAARGLGAVYTRTHDGRPLRSIAGKDELLSRYYDPHHAKLDRWCDMALDQHGRCLVIDCHSFPSKPLPCDLDQMTNRPDICIGTDRLHTPSRLWESARCLFEENGWTVEIDRPYAGTMTPASRYGVDKRVHSLMVEVNRRLYMDEASGGKSQAFDEVRTTLRTVLSQLVEEWEKNA